MRDGTRLVAVKLTGLEREAAELLVAAGHYDTLSRLLRAALVAELLRHDLPTELLANIRLSRVRHPMRRRKKEEADGSGGGEPSAG